MIKDVTFGQYIYNNSPVHRMDPRIKIIFTILLIVILFVAKTIPGLIVNILLLLLIYAVAGIPFKMVLKSLKPVLPIVLFTGVVNLFFIMGEGEPLVSFWKLHIYKEAIVFAVMLAVRFSMMVAGSSLLTYTTSPIEMTDAIERLLWPFKLVKLPVHELAMMMTIALRFIPLLIDETVKIMNAQKSRGADLDTGKLMQRVKALIPILVPLFISSFRRADELALAMECRCYRGGDGRTRMKQLHMKLLDLFGSVIFLTFACGVVVCNYFFLQIL